MILEDILLKAFKMEVRSVRCSGKKIKATSRKKIQLMSEINITGEKLFKSVKKNCGNFLLTSISISSLNLPDKNLSSFRSLSL